MKKNESVRIQIPRYPIKVDQKRDEKVIRDASTRLREFDRIHDALAMAGVPHDTSESHDECFIRISGATLVFTGWANKKPGRFVRSFHWVRS